MEVDLDGHSTYSGIIKIQLNSSAIVAAFYQAQSNSIQVNLNRQQGNVQWQLFSASGQLVHQGRVNNTSSCTLKLPVLAEGIYMLQVFTDSNIYAQKIFIGR
jgi:hypothetical protein